MLSTTSASTFSTGILTNGSISFRYASASGYSTSFSSASSHSPSGCMSFTATASILHTSPFRVPLVEHPRQPVLTTTLIASFAAVKSVGFLFSIAALVAADSFAAFSTAAASATSADSAASARSSSSSTQAPFIAFSIGSVPPK